MPKIHGGCGNQELTQQYEGMQCHFLNTRVGNGAWSFEGLERTDMDENNTMIRCSSTHLTSFAILVNVGGSVTPTVSCSKFLDAYGIR